MKTAAQLKAEIEQIDLQLSKLNKKLEQVNDARMLLERRREELQELLTRDFPAFVELKHNYKDLTLTDALISVIENAAISLTPTEILARLSDNLYLKKVNSAYSNVYVMCTKLARRGIIKEVKKRGRRAFIRK